MKNSPSSHVCVCICTFKRPSLLARLLDAVDTQVTDGLFTVSVVIVDNDRAESARSVAHSFAAASKNPLKYCVEPEQNIALARNRAIGQAEGELIALVDDDEIPGEDWLIRLHETLHVHHAQGVLGPVRPCFETSPPDWVVTGAFCERPSFPTGTILREPRQTRTGNALLLRRILIEEAGPFDHRFGRTGGEDVDFFSRRLRRGDRFVWCNEAPVYENVPPERMTRAYLLRRALLRGVANAEKVQLLSVSMAKSVAAVVLYTAMLPVLIPWRHDVFMRYLVRNCDHIGKMLAVCGVKLVRERGAA